MSENWLLDIAPNFVFVSRCFDTTVVYDKKRWLYLVTSQISIVLYVESVLKRVEA
jgi:hypothetical protein